MSVTRRLLLALTVGVPLAAHGADRPVHLHVPRPVGKDAAAMPRIADPADPSERRINAAVQRLDAALRREMAACKEMGGRNYDWERTVDVPMRGPGFLSYTITDSTYCGGAHPNTGTMAIVYDLRSGAPVDWSRLLPASWTGTLTLEQGPDGSRMVALRSDRLFALYLRGYEHAHATAGDAECREVVRQERGDGVPAMQVWLDVVKGGLAVQFGLPHAMLACEDAVVIPRATLRAEGAAPMLLEALAAAHGG